MHHNTDKRPTFDPRVTRSVFLLQHSFSIPFPFPTYITSFPSRGIPTAIHPSPVLSFSTSLITYSHHLPLPSHSTSSVLPYLQHPIYSLRKGPISPSILKPSIPSPSIDQSQSSTHILSPSIDQSQSILKINVQRLRFSLNH